MTSGNMIVVVKQTMWGVSVLTWIRQISVIEAPWRKLKKYNLSNAGIESGMYLQIWVFFWVPIQHSSTPFMPCPKVKGTYKAGKTKRLFVWICFSIIPVPLPLSLSRFRAGDINIPRPQWVLNLEKSRSCLLAVAGTKSTNFDTCCLSTRY
jgi:hypothetical protein